MYNTPPTTQVARKPHQCTFCAEAIKVGEKYERWASVEDTYFTNKMHLECVEAAREDGGCGGFEYIAYSNERPSPALGERQQEGD